MTKQLSIAQPESDIRTNTIRSTVIIAIVVSTGISVFHLYYALTAHIWQAWALFADTTILALADLIGLVMVRRGRPTVAVWILIIVSNLGFIAGSFLLRYSGILAGIGSALLMSLLALQALSSNRERIIATSLSIISGMTCVLVDQFGSPNRPEIPEQVFLFIAIAVAITGVGFFVTALREFKNFNLQTKTVFVFVISTALVTVGGSVASLQIVRSILEQDASEKLRSAANHTRDLVDTFIQTQLNNVRVQAQYPIVREYLLDVNNPDKNLELNNTLQALRQEDQRYIISYGVLDTNGTVVADTNATNVGTVEGNYDYIAEPLKVGLPYMSVWYSTNSLYFSAPVSDGKGKIIGVLRLQYRISILQQLILNNNELGGPASFPILLDENYVILSHGISSDLLLKPAVQMSPEKLASVIASGRLSENAKNLSAVMPTLERVLADPNNKNIFNIQDTNGATLNVTINPLVNAPWFIVYGQPQDVYFGTINSWGHISTLLAMGITLLTIFLATSIAGVLINPITRLTLIAKEIADGNLKARVEMQRNDEIGELASTFDQMTDKLNTSLVTLEDRIIERTTDLETARVQSEKRAQEMQIIAEISRYISTEKDLEKLLPLVAQTVSERFGFYHVGIFLLDDTRRYAMLRAANSPGGQVMLRRQHRLEVGHTGIVGNVTSTGVPRIALDTGSDIAYFNNPDLPETRSEMALPLTVRGSIIGALDVQSKVQNAFTQADISVLSLLADQVAIAIDNARLIEETQTLLAESQSVFREYLADAWQKKSVTKVVGYQQSIAGGKPLTSTSVQEVEETEQADGSAINVPIRVRDQIIGMLNIHPAETGREWKTDEINVVNAVAERLGLALDNARLFEETSTRASRERLVSEITTQIRSSNDPQEMIKIAVAELQRALGATRVEVVPQKSAPPPDR